MTHQEKAGSSLLDSINEVVFSYHIKKFPIFFQVFHKLWNYNVIKLSFPIIDVTLTLILLNELWSF